MSESELRGWVRQHIAKLLNVHADELDLNQTLESFGMDSVDAVLMAGEMEEFLNIEIDPAALLQYPTIEQMVAAMERWAAQSGQATAPP